MTCQGKDDLSDIVKLEINGKEIELNEFVQNMISGTIRGMVKSLRDVDDIETIDLEVSKKSI